MKFTYKAYEDLVSLLINKKYSFVSYHNYRNFEKCVIMRHDVDYSLDKAVFLAKLEKDLGIKSTYFVLISSPFYNLLSLEERKKVEKILNNGHEIGLHFDELNYTEEEYKRIGGRENIILEEVGILEKIIKDIPIKAVSMHRPSKETLNANYDFGDIVNSYGKEFFNEFKYVSDSRRRWRENVEAIISSNEYDKLHILTHAFWYNDEEKNIKDSIMDFINAAREERYSCFNRNITNLEDIIKG